VSDSLRWRKSRRSAQGNCVEVAWHDGRVLVRDTQDHIGPVLRFSLAAWRRFAGQVKRPLASGPAEGPDRRECVQGALWCLGALSSLCLELFPRWPGSAGIRVSARRCAGFLLCRGRRGRQVVAGARSAPSGGVRPEGSIIYGSIEGNNNEVVRPGVPVVLPGSAGSR
jgi:hypothetical protein